MTTFDARPEPEYKPHRIDFHTKATGRPMFLIIPATDAFTLIDQLRYLLFAEDCNYVLDSVRILEERTPDDAGGQNVTDLYLCDRRKNAGCNGTVCFYDGVTPLCHATTDPACAVTGADGEPIRIKPFDHDTIQGDEGRLYHAEAADAAGAANNL